MESFCKKKVIDKVNVYCLLTENGYNDIDRIGVNDTRDYIIEHYKMANKNAEAIEAQDIINLLPTSQIRDEKLVDMWERLQFCKQHPSVSPYEGAYEDMPKMYIEFCKLVSHCSNMKYQLERETKKRK